MSGRWSRDLAPEDGAARATRYTSLAGQHARFEPRRAIRPASLPLLVDAPRGVEAVDERDRRCSARPATFEAHRRTKIRVIGTSERPRTSTVVVDCRTPLEDALPAHPYRRRAARSQRSATGRGHIPRCGMCPRPVAAVLRQRLRTRQGSGRRQSGPREQSDRFVNSAYRCYLYLASIASL